MKSTLEHIYEHPMSFIIYNKDDRWYSIRPLGEDEYWIESDEGEGTGVKQHLLYDVINKLFKETM